MKRYFSLILLLTALTLRAEMKLSGQADWSKGKTFAPGMKYMEFTFHEPRLMRGAAMVIALDTPKLSFLVTPRDPDWGKPMPDAPKYTIRTRRTTCRSFMKNANKNGRNMVAVVNGSPWRPWERPFTHRYSDNLGLTVSDGVVVDAPNGRPGLVVYKDGKVDLAHIAKDADLSTIRHAISGFGIALDKGKATGNDKALAPRTGYGLDQEKKTLIFVVIDGRQKGYSEGASVYETGELLAHFGAFTGVNMDGGGSTTMIVRENGKLLKLNHHGRDAERTVGGAIGICLDGK